MFIKKVTFVILSITALHREVINFDHNLFMASLDVEMLLTNIPMDETIKNAINNLFSNKMYQGKL